MLTEFFDGISKFLSSLLSLNEVKKKAVKNFGMIMVILVGVYFFYRLFEYNEFFIRLINADIPNWMLIVVVGFIVYFIVRNSAMKIVKSAMEESKKNIMSAVVDVLKTEKESMKKMITEALDEVNAQAEEYKKWLFNQTSIINEKGWEFNDQLRTELNADIVTAQMFHNGQKFSGGVDMMYYNECFPSVNRKENIVFRNEEWQDMRTSVFKFTSHLKNIKYGLFTPEEINEFDPVFSAIIKDNNCGYIALCFVETTIDICILTCSWQKGHEDRMPDATEIEIAMKSTAARYEETMDINEYIKKNKR